MRTAWILIAVASALAGCAKKSGRELDHELIRVTSDARLRTDTIGEGAHAELATFVLVEAENTSKDGAYVTLAGELADAAGATLGELKAQSLWIPAGEISTFALIDRERKPRPTAQAARIRVRGVRTGAPPPARVEGARVVPDGDKVLLQGVVKSEAARGVDIYAACFCG